MEKIKCILSYDGTNFAGSQIQPKKRTVQGEIEKALRKIHQGKHIRIQASGRTDSGVHAKGQTFQFNTSLNILEHNWKKALNRLLPKDIYIHGVKKVPSNFHVRYDVVEKEYRYFIWNNEEADVFKRNYSYFYPHPLNISLMKKACLYLEGEHDFTAFSSARAAAKGSKVRKLFQVTCDKYENEIVIIVRGNGFLYHMVRIIVGLLIDIGKGLRNPSDIPELIAAKDRRLLGDTVPPQGLYLWNVTYDYSKKNVTMDVNKKLQKT